MHGSFSAGTSQAVSESAPGRVHRLEDRQFALMQQAFAQSGGIHDGDRVGRIMRAHWDQPVSALARWIVDRRIVSFNHHGATWIPTFQFDLDSMDLDPSAARVIDELVPAFDDWDLALWFASPNDALEGAAPVSVLAMDPDAVLIAARIDRFVVLG